MAAEQGTGDLLLQTGDIESLSVSQPRPISEWKAKLQSSLETETSATLLTAEAPITVKGISDILALIEQCEAKLNEICLADNQPGSEIYYEQLGNKYFVFAVFPYGDGLHRTSVYEFILPSELEPQSETAMGEPDIALIFPTAVQAEQELPNVQYLEASVQIKPTQTSTEHLLEEEFWDEVSSIQYQEDTYLPEEINKLLELQFGEHPVFTHVHLPEKNVLFCFGNTGVSVTFELTTKVSAELERYLEDPKPSAVKTLLGNFEDSVSILEEKALVKKREKIEQEIPGIWELKLKKTIGESMDAEDEKKLELVLDRIDKATLDELERIEVKINAYKDLKDDLSDEFQIVECFGYEELHEQISEYDKIRLVRALTEEKAVVLAQLDAHIRGEITKLFISGALKKLSKPLTDDEIELIREKFPDVSASLDIVSPAYGYKMMMKIVDRLRTAEIEVVQSPANELFTAVWSDAIPVLLSDNPTVSAERASWQVTAISLAIHAKEKSEATEKIEEEFREILAAVEASKVCDTELLVEIKKKSILTFLSSTDTETYKKFIKLLSQFENADNGLQRKWARKIRNYREKIDTEIKTEALRVISILDYIDPKIVGTGLLELTEKESLDTLTNIILHSALSSEEIKTLANIENLKKEKAKNFSHDIQQKFLDALRHSLKTHGNKKNIVSQSIAQLCDDIQQLSEFGTTLAEFVCSRLEEDVNTFYEEICRLFESVDADKPLDLGWKPAKD